MGCDTAGGVAGAGVGAGGAAKAALKRVDRLVGHARIERERVSQAGAHGDL